MYPHGEAWKKLSLEWLYLDMNSYFASVEQQLNPTFRNKPLIVVPMVTDSTCAIAASYEAKAYGIKTGTPVYEAKKMCPGIICVPADHRKYVTLHHQILAEIEHHIPISMVASIDEVACKLMGPQREKEEAFKLAKRIKEGLRRNVGEYVRCSIGIASNRFLAKVATDLDKPDGLRVIHNDSLPGCLSSMELGDLPGIGRSMQKHLERNGIFSIEQLWELTPNRMRSIWHNVAGERFWYMIRGIDVPSIETKRSTVGHSKVLAPDQRPIESAKVVGHKLLLKAAVRLRHLNHYAQEMSLSLRLENNFKLKASCKFYRVSDSITLTRQFLSLWDELSSKEKLIRLKKISIALNNLIPVQQTQQNLFERQTGSASNISKKHENLSCVIDDLNSRYGKNTVSIGHTNKNAENFSQEKIAFALIPDEEEFF